MDVINLSPYAAQCRPSISPQGDDLAVVVVAAHFDFPLHPRAGLRMCEQQYPAPMDDTYNGEPESSSLRVEGQCAPTRPGTDIYVLGHAWTPGGHRATHAEVSVRVGRWTKRALAIGTRYWVWGMGELVISKPQVFDRMPLIYELGFGGTPPHTSASSTRVAGFNPVGRGLFDRATDAADQPLPNLEDPDGLIHQLSARPMPVGFGPIARAWQPRARFAGTYDQAWIEERAPLWPEDMDTRLFCAASPGLCAVPHLRGGETVELVGLSPDGPIHFVLPDPVLQAKFEFRGGVQRKRMILDALTLDADLRRVTMIWRASAVASEGLVRLESTVVRTLQTWEREA